MKVKSVLFKISGILKCVAGGLMIGLFTIMLLLSGFFKEAMVQSYAEIELMIEELVTMDPEYVYLLDLEAVEVVDFLMGMVNTFSIVMIILGVCAIVLAVFNFIFAKRYNQLLQGRLGRKILFTVLSFVFYWGILSNVLTTVALYLKDENSDTIIIEN